MKLKTLLTTTLTSLMLVTSVISGMGQELPTSWTGDTDISTFKETTTIHGGASSVKVLVNTGTQANCDIASSVEIPVTAGTTFTFSAYVYSSAHVKARVVYTWTGAAISYSAAYSTAASTAFDLFTESGTVPTGATGVKVGLRFYDQASFVAGEIQYVDDVTFASPTGTALTVTNGDFESWPAPDTQAPVATFAPAAAAIDVAVTSPINITFDEAIRNIDDSPIADPTSLITLKETDAAGTAVTFTATIDAAKKVITITPSAALKFAQAYYVAIAPVEDVAGNATVENTSTFTTFAGRSDKSILTYALNDQTTAATIGDGTIAVEVASSATVATLVATFTISDGSSIKVGAIDQVSGVTINDFTAPVTYVVTAEDGTTKDWVVTVTKAATLNDANDIITFSLVEQTGPAVINPTDHTVVIEVAYGTIITTLTPTITVSAGAGIEPNTGVPQDYTAPVAYTVTAENGAIQPWTVTVTIAAAPVTLTNTTTLAAKYYAGNNLNVTWTATNMANVKVEWFNGTVWSEVAASVPATDGQYAIAIPAATNYGVAYKFRISNAADATLNAESAAFTVIATTDNLATLIGLPVESIVKYIGKATITYARTSYNQKYLQDVNGAVLIHDVTTAPGYITDTYAIGEGISNIEGKVTLYNGLIELVPQATTGEKVTGNPTITPEVRTIASLTHADQCKLVQIQGLTITTPTQWDAGGLFVTGKNYDVTGVANTVFSLRTAFAEANYIGTAVPATAQNVVGLVGQYNALMQITPRNLADMTPVTGINDNDAVSTKVFPNPFTSDFTINAGKVVRNVTVSNMLGQRVMAGTYNQVEVNVPASDLKTGVYFVSIKFEDGTSTTLRMVKK